MSSYEEGFLFGTIHGFYLCGRSAAQTYIDIRRITGVDLYSQADIDECFKSFQTEIHTELMQDVVDDVRRIKETARDEEGKVLLDDMPYPIQRQIVLGSNLESRLSLREVSKPLEKLVKIVPFYINTLTVAYNTAYIQIFTDEGYQKQYDMAFSGCVIHGMDGKDQLVERSAYYDCASEELMALLEFRNLKIGSLRFIRADQIWQQPAPSVLIEETERFLIKFISLFKGNQKVEQLVIRSCIPMVAQCLQEMSTSVCKRIVHNEFYAHDTTFSFGEEFYQSDKWKNLECFSSDIIFFYPPDQQTSIVDFCHLSHAEIRLSSFITVADIWNLQNILMQNSKLQEMTIWIRWFDGELERMNDLLGIRNIDLLNGPVWTAFPQGQDRLFISCEEFCVAFKGPCYKPEDPFQN